ncbi:gamma carbonic anhydrase family protein [Lysobacter sp. H21R4]|uniref:gamma carbonic anhydrase family protein n=1 Tax=Lysobacter sp. H21R4 TaxID=2781021 RepID=UPI00188995C8|nr:gamma carbonic anhydrase family protein [Lysobacter sp. H21R4]QOY62848.1 gamma carbonic anhydrase family protein [Lysobacter sp. H21R4]
MSIRPFLEHTPRLGARVYVDPAATVIGNVVLEDDVSIWPGCVVRGDVNSIHIGARTNIQDGAIIHVTHEGPFTRPGGFPTVIANDVTVGHSAVIHACRLEEFCLVGMGAVVLDGATVSRFGFVGAGAVVAPGKTVGEGELWLGSPARFVRKLSERELEQLRHSAQHYVQLKDAYLKMAESA